MIHQRKDYPDIISHNRFVEIMQFALVPLTLCTIKARFGNVNSMKKIEKTAKICYNENNHKLKVAERRLFMEQIAIFCDTDDFCKAYEKY